MNQFEQTAEPSSTSASIYTMLTALLNFVCATTDWEYGESWIPDQAFNTLELSLAWCSSNQIEIHRAIAWSQFQLCSQAFVLHRNEGLPGRVWASQKTEWITDASAHSETYFLRHQIAQAFSVKAGFGVPILVDSKVLAVVVFFMSTAQPENPVLIQQTQDAIAQFRQLLPFE